MKSIQVYKTKKDFKIVTLYKRESDSYIISDPIFIMPIDTKLEDLENKLFEALNTSRTLKESEEDKFYSGNLLKKIKESSFNKFYAGSSSCYVSLEKGIISITPQKYMGNNQGLEREDDKTYQVTLNDNNRLEVVKDLIQMLANE
jgi:hypothetical protein